MSNLYICAEAFDVILSKSLIIVEKIPWKVGTCFSVYFVFPSRNKRADWKIGLRDRKGSAEVVMQPPRDVIVEQRGRRHLPVTSSGWRFRDAH